MGTYGGGWVVVWMGRGPLALVIRKLKKSPDHNDSLTETEVDTFLLCVLEYNYYKEIMTVENINI